MPRVPLVEPVAEPAELRPVFNQLRETRGRVPSMYRTLAHHPAVLTAHRGYFHAALDSGTLSRAFKEKIAYKVAQMRGSSYSTSSHKSYALKHGVSPDELAAIDRSDYSALETSERLALEFAEAVVRNDGKVPGTLFDVFATHFTPAQIVELVALIGIMELASTMAAVFELGPD